MEIQKLLDKQRDFFRSGKTKDLKFRKDSLRRLRNEILKREKDIYKALDEDLRKPEFEVYGSEIYIVLEELSLMLKKLKKWSKPKRIRTNLLNFPSNNRIYRQPYGNCLIISPWNYPLHLSFSPLIGAISAGNTVILKPSELSSNTSKLIFEISDSCFEDEHVAVVEGDAEIATMLLKQKWDYIFYTGSVTKGKIVAKMAAESLTPVTLELGGKNPCIVEKTANLNIAARRIVWGKFLNGGQSCVAPDYVIIHESLKESFINLFKIEINKAYGEDVKSSSDLTRIINRETFNRLLTLIKDEKILCGGEADENDLYIEPCLIDSPSMDSKLMKDEIFGPILPLLTYNNESEINNIISSFERPLSLYIFSSDKSFINRSISKYSFGGGAINDTVIQYINNKLPFGGIGNSGYGAYHGKYTFDTFSHSKSITRKFGWLDIPLKYAPYGNKINILKKILK